MVKHISAEETIIFDLFKSAASFILIKRLTAIFLAVLIFQVMLTLGQGSLSSQLFGRVYMFFYSYVTSQITRLVKIVKIGKISISFPLCAFSNNCNIYGGNYLTQNPQNTDTRSALNSLLEAKKDVFSQAGYFRRRCSEDGKIMSAAALQWAKYCALSPDSMIKSSTGTAGKGISSCTTWPNQFIRTKELP